MGFMQDDATRLVVIDGHSQIFRALHKPGPELTAPTGEPTRGTYFFCRMLFAMVDETNPSHLVMANDWPRHETFRRKLYPAYKANRDGDEMPEDMVIQINRIRQIVSLLGVPQLVVPEMEADDVIATLTTRAHRSFDDVVIISRDKDLHQLIKPNVRMFDPIHHDWWSEKQVEAKWGVSPSRTVEVQVLAGDGGDNVPGVKGCGLKTAIKLIKTYGDVDGVVAAAKAGKLTPALTKNILATDMVLMRKLVTMRDNLPLRPKWRNFEFVEFDLEAAAPVFDELGFREWC